MRGLKALVIGMGILIVIGLAVVVVTIAKRTSDRSGGGADTAPTGRVFATDVAIPAGARVVETTADGGRVLVRLALPGGKSRILVIDAATGRRLGTIDLVPE